ncbi:ABC transporter permease [Actinoplanes sp. NPDC048796]|uniref:ABC transporter permease n=1 Tax=unclassified Actinoplanes TaxID=2626549 RepID=UPI0033E07BB4
MPSPIKPSRLRARDLAGEALAGVGQRPGRTLLTMIGTILGVGAFTLTLGLTSTASGQISRDFTELAATQVVVQDVGTPHDREVRRTVDDFPADADARIERLNGVVHAGVTWPVFSKKQPQVSASPIAPSHPIATDAVSPGYLRALHPALRSGVLFDRFHDQRKLRVAVLGSAAAAQLGIANVASAPAVFVDGVGYTVVGILDAVQRNPDALLKVLLPAGTARAEYGPPSVDTPPGMLIETRLGAAPLIAAQAPRALRPDRPELLAATPPPDPRQIQDQVAGNLDTLFLLLAGLTLIIGAAGITNTTLVAVMERTNEIGIRRSLGARPRHIAWQFLTESALLGTLGGLVGCTIGVCVTVVVALANQWTAVLDPATTLAAPLIGTVTGLLAGAYPALRAARIEPLEALRR